MGIVFKMLAVAVALSARNLPPQGVQRWRRRNLARKIAREVGVHSWNMFPAEGGQL